jgi:Cof subfamily protein (haloacid dehalogenase superfamily)
VARKRPASPKLVAFDLDGTLIGTDLTIRPRVREAVARMLRRGVAGCVVTGRMYRATLPYVRELGFETPVVCYQGAAVVDPGHDTVLLDVPLRNAIVLELTALAHRDGMHLQLYRNDEYYAEERNRFSDLYARLSGVQPVVVPSLARAFETSDATKAVVIADAPTAAKYAERLHAALGDRAYVTRSYPEFVEVLSPEVDKGSALEFLAGHLGTPMDEVVAIGDSWNDLPFLQAAGFGIAMGSAPAELLNAADAVVADADHDGVAEALDEYVLR